MRILITGCGALSKELIDDMRNNKDGEEIFVVGINNNQNALLKTSVNKAVVVPSITDKNYLPTLLNICRKYDIQVIIPYITKELPILAKNRHLFEDNGIRVSVASSEALAIVNDKVELQKKFGKYMPPQIIPNNIEEVESFIKKYGNVCCKIKDGCGGVGFCVIDEQKAFDICLIGKTGKPKYITKSYLSKLLELYKGKIILQKYINGLDYSTSALSENGNVKAICGYVGYEMQYGCVVDGEIKKNEKAYAIHKEIIEKTKLDGNSCADFIIDGDNVYLLEINPRINGSLPFVTKSGADFLYDRCKMLIGEYKEKEYHFNYGLKMEKYFAATYF